MISCSCNLIIFVARNIISINGGNSFSGTGVVNFNIAVNCFCINAAKLKGKVICRFVTYSTVNNVVRTAIKHNQFAAALLRVCIGIGIGIGNGTGQVNTPTACLLNILSKDFVGFGVIPCFDVVNKLTIFINSAAFAKRNQIVISHIFAVISGYFTFRFLVAVNKVL